MKLTQHIETDQKFKNGSVANKLPERFFSVGFVARAHGVRGEVWVNLPRRTALPLLDEITHVFLGCGRSRMKIISFRFHRGGLLLMLDGCGDRKAAEVLRGQEVFIQSYKQESLKTGEYYVDDLIGLNVRTEQGEYLGELVEVLPTGANDVYRVLKSGDELLIPAITTVIRAIELGKGELVVRLLPGLRS